MYLCNVFYMHLIFSNINLLFIKYYVCIAQLLCFTLICFHFGTRCMLRMWVFAVISAAWLLASPAQAGIKELSSHFSEPSSDPDPRGFDQAGLTDMDAIPVDFHKENTVTSDLPYDGFDDEDYIDFDKILAEGSDDYRQEYRSRYS